jgi:hypothetical protein
LADRLHAPGDAGHHDPNRKECAFHTEIRAKIRVIRVIRGQLS